MISFCGTDYLVAWEDHRNGVDWDIYGARVTQTGNVLDTSGIAISDTSTDQSSPSIVFDNADFLVTWHDSRSGSDDDIYGARISQTGTVLDPSGIQVSAAVRDQTFPAIALGTSNCLAVWQDDRNLSSACDIYGSRIDQSGGIIDTSGVMISTFFTEVNEQDAPDIAFGNANYLVVWQDGRSISTDICGVRLDQSGSTLDSLSFVISFGCSTSSQWNPAAAFDGTNYLVVWVDDRNGPYSDIYGARIDTEGNLLDSTGIAICTVSSRQLCPALAFDGTNYLVVWQDDRNYYLFDIYGARIDQSGNVLDPNGFPIATAWGLQIVPALAFDGTNYLVAWQDQGSPLSPNVFGSRVDQYGNVLDTSVIVISGGTGFQGVPAVASDGTNYLVVWQEGDVVLSDYDIYAARLDQDGNVLDTAGIAICTTSTNQLYPAVAFDGTHYIIVWQDSIAGTSDIYGAKLSTSGIVVDSFTISLQPGNQNCPTLAHGIGDQVLVTYSGWTGDLGGITYDAMRIWGKFYPYIGAEEEVMYAIKDIGFNVRTYPNPVQTKCSIVYTLTTDSEISMAIFDVTGRVVQGLVSGRKNAGTHRETVEMSDLAQGVYFIRIENQSKVAIEKITLIR